MKYIKYLILFQENKNYSLKNKKNLYLISITILIFSIIFYKKNKKNNLDSQEHLDQKENLDSQEHLDQKENLDLQEHLNKLDQKENLDLQEHLHKKEEIIEFSEEEILLKEDLLNKIKKNNILFYLYIHGDDLYPKKYLKINVENFINYLPYLIFNNVKTNKEKLDNILKEIEGQKNKILQIEFYICESLQEGYEFDSDIEKEIFKNLPEKINGIENFIDHSDDSRLFLCIDFHDFPNKDLLKILEDNEDIQILKNYYNELKK